MTASLGIIALVPDTWQGVVSTRHQVLGRLAQHLPVVWMDSALNWRDYYYPGGKRFMRGDRWQQPHPGLDVLVPGLSHPDFVRPDGLRRRMLASRLAAARQRLLRRGVKKIALYLWRPAFAEAIELVEHDYSCYHIDDEYGFSTTPVPNSAQETALIARVDQVIVHTPALFEKKGGINPNTTIVPNGVDYATFSTPQAMPADLAPLAGPRIGYVGWIKKQLDFDCLIALARVRPQYSLVMVGPIGNVAGKEAQLATLQSLPNVHFLGVKSASELAAYAQHFDVCLMCYEVNDYTNFIYPLKLHEYLAAGKPIVSAAITTAKAFAEVVDIADDNASWLAAVDRSLLAAANSPERRAARQACARSHDWNALVERIAHLFEEGCAHNSISAAHSLPR